MEKDIFQYEVNDEGTMTIFVQEGNTTTIIAELSDCLDMTEVQKEALMTEVLADLGYIKDTRYCEVLQDTMYCNGICGECNVEPSTD